MPRKSDQKYRITIRNWDEYQRPLKGTGERRRRRNWIAVSVDLFSDPDFLELSHTSARLWLGLLLHAGKVGPEFSMTPARAVSMFCLRRPCDFSILEKQGFIDLQKPTNKQNKHNKHTKLASAKPPPDYPDGLNIKAWESYEKHRREMHYKKLSERGARSRMKKMAGYPLEVQNAAVQASIDNGWQGLFLDKAEANAKGNSKGLSPEEKEKQHTEEVNILAELMGIEGKQGESADDFEARVMKANERRVAALGVVR